ncbi:hypothetical protein IWQ60_010766 [Tieghemiomyces parasiticus]|uniref:Uncharacterized protein n=1 Tax=Tieghemiomyces parasiticus TaxID=78921 RepID=A0A9W7ZPY7_9FUNG|nr:hypothetical protein IWQ60_010766 [Tieghemiomyces parasiticus]
MKAAHFLPLLIASIATRYALARPSAAATTVVGHSDDTSLVRRYLTSDTGPFSALRRRRVLASPPQQLERRTPAFGFLSNIVKGVVGAFKGNKSE